MAKLGPCPRCGGSGRITGFSHVAMGVCFLCGGSGKVTGTAQGTTPVGPAQPGKHVDLEGFGPSWVTRDAVGGFRVQLQRGMGVFDVINNQVQVDLVSDGLKKQQRKLQRALQKALKVKP